MENNENIEKTQETAVVQADNKQTADDKVRAIRMPQETFEEFKRLVSSAGFKTQGAAFSQLLSYWRLNHASDEMQEQAANVELVQSLTSQISDLFVAQFAAMQSLERSAKNAVSLKTQELEQELAAAVAAATEANEKAEKATAEKVAAVADAVADAKAAKEQAAQAIKDAQAAEAAQKAQAEEVAKAHEKAEKAVAGLSAIKATLDDLRKAKEDAEIVASKASANNDALRQEIKSAKAEAAKVASLQERITELKQELKDAKSEIKEANKSAQSVADKLIEIEKAHSKALDELREKERGRYDKAVAEAKDVIAGLRQQIDELQKSHGAPEHSQANDWARSVETPNNKQ